MVAEAVIEQQRREFGGGPASSAAQVSGQFNPYIGVGLVLNLVLIGNVTVGQPVGFNNAPVGTKIYLIMTQDATGSRTVAWASCYRDTPNWSAGGAAGTTASSEFMWDGQSWQYMGGSTAFAAPGVSIFTGAGQVIVLPVAPVVKTNPAPSVGAVAAAGVAPVVTQRTSTVIGPAVGAVAAAGVAPVLGVGITPSNTPGFSLALTGNAPIRNP